MWLMVSGLFMLRSFAKIAARLWLLAPCKAHSDDLRNGPQTQQRRGFQGNPTASGIATLATARLRRGERATKCEPPQADALRAMAWVNDICASMSNRRTRCVLGSAAM